MKLSHWSVFTCGLIVGGALVSSAFWILANRYELHSTQYWVIRLDRWTGECSRTNPSGNDGWVEMTKPIDPYAGLGTVVKQ